MQTLTRGQTPPLSAASSSRRTTRGTTRTLPSSLSTCVRCSLSDLRRNCRRSTGYGSSSSMRATAARRRVSRRAQAMRFCSTTREQELTAVVVVSQTRRRRLRRVATTLSVDSASTNSGSRLFCPPRLVCSFCLFPVTSPLRIPLRLLRPRLALGHIAPDEGSLRLFYSLDANRPNNICEGTMARARRQTRMNHRTPPVRATHLSLPTLAWRTPRGLLHFPSFPPPIDPPSILERTRACSFSPTSCNICARSRFSLLPPARKGVSRTRPDTAGGQFASVNSEHGRAGEREFASMPERRDNNTCGCSREYERQLGRESDAWRVAPSDDSD